MVESGCLSCHPANSVKNWRKFGALTDPQLGNIIHFFHLPLDSWRRALVTLYQVSHCLWNQVPATAYDMFNDLFMTYLTYALTLPVEHRPQTTRLHPALSCAAVSIFLQLNLKPAVLYADVGMTDDRTWLQTLAANFPSIQPTRQPRTYFFNH